MVNIPLTSKAQTARCVVLTRARPNAAADDPFKIFAERDNSAHIEGYAAL